MGFTIRFSVKPEALPAHFGGSKGAGNASGAFTSRTNHRGAEPSQVPRADRKWRPRGSRAVRLWSREVPVLAGFPVTWAPAEWETGSPSPEDSRTAMGFEAARGGPGFGAWHLTKAGRGGDTSRNVGSRRELPPRHTAGCGGSRPSGGNRADDCAARVLGPGSRWPWLGRSPPGRSARSRLALRTVGRPCLCVGLGTGTHGRGGSVLERQVLERQVLEVTAQGNSIFCRTIPWKAALMILGLSKCERRTVLGRGAGTGSS